MRFFSSLQPIHWPAFFPLGRISHSLWATWMKTEASFPEELSVESCILEPVCSDKTPVQSPGKGSCRHCLQVKLHGWQHSVSRRQVRKRQVNTHKAATQLLLKKAFSSPHLAWRLSSESCCHDRLYGLLKMLFPYVVSFMQQGWRWP